MFKSGSGSGSEEWLLSLNATNRSTHGFFDWPVFKVLWDLCGGKDSQELIRDEAREELGEFQPVIYTRSQVFSQIVLYTIISYVIPTTLDEYLTEPKSLPAALVLAVTVPFTMEAIKLFFNASAALNKDFDLYWGADAAQMLVLIPLACGFYYLEMGENWSSVGCNAAISVLGIALKLISDFAIVPCVHANFKKKSFVNQWLFPTESNSENHHANRWYNHFAMHSARFLILFSAMKAGSEAFEVMGATPGLLWFMAQCGITELAAVYAFSLIFNEMFGGTFFLASDWFKGAYPTYASRLVTLIIMSYTFQYLPSIKNEASFAAFIVPVLATFFVDLLMQMTPVGLAIDKPVNYGAGFLLSKCGVMKLENTQGEVVYSPISSGPNPNGKEQA